MDFRLRYLVYSILLHVLLFVLLIASSFFTRPIEIEPVMTAVLVSPPPRPKPPPPKPPEPKPEPPKPEPPKPKPEPPKPPEPTPEQRVADVLRKLDCDTIPDLKAEAGRRIAVEAAVIYKQIALMEAKCKKKEEDKKKQDEAAEKKRLEQEALKEKQEQERQKKEEEKRQKEEDLQRQKDLQQQLAEEQRQREEAERAAQQAALEAAAAAEANARADALADKAIQEWAGRLKEKVRRYWIQPPNMSDSLVAKVRISWLPSGTVTKVSIVQSSGNAGYDDSVQRAILKSDPLPALNDARAYDKARDLILNFPAKELTH
ncbi:MAG TPA: cell envelope integrity protein TolA [Nevskiaceae bacterium]|nr:cell envelope integrity protein TolA [Nevskiaceae bacterium]